MIVVVPMMTQVTALFTYKLIMHRTVSHIVSTVVGTQVFLKLLVQLALHLRHLNLHFLRLWLVVNLLNRKNLFWILKVTGRFALRELKSRKTYNLAIIELFFAGYHN